MGKVEPRTGCVSAKSCSRPTTPDGPGPGPGPYPRWFEEPEPARPERADIKVRANFSIDPRAQETTPISTPKISTPRIKSNRPESGDVYDLNGSKRARHHRSAVSRSRRSRSAPCRTLCVPHAPIRPSPTNACRNSATPGPSVARKPFAERTFRSCVISNSPSLSSHAAIGFRLPCVKSVRRQVSQCR